MEALLERREADRRDEFALPQIDASEPPLRVQLLVLPRFSLLSFTAAIEPLRVANRLYDRNLYNWHLVSIDGGAVKASNGTVILTDHAIASAPDCDMILVCASFEVPELNDRRVWGYLRRRGNRGVVLGGVGVGCIVLARAGVLGDRRCAVHWENRPAFVEAFPTVDVSTNLYEIDKGLVTCGGGVAALDMMLHLVAQKHGANLAVAVSSQLLHERLRSPDDHQRTAATLLLKKRSPYLAAAIEVMEANVERPLAVPEIATQIGIAQRQLERLFRKHLGTTPQKHYVKTRLERAASLLASSSMSVLEVAMACGFASGSHFSNSFQEHFGVTPRAHRLTASSSLAPHPSPAATLS
jgi:AraC family carnitine catabolism transcriptional activator